MPAPSKSTVIIKATFKPNGMNTPEFKEYSRRSNANGEANGGEVRGKYRISENLTGGETPHLIFIIEYPTAESARNTFTNKEYQSLLPLRSIAFQEVEVFIANPMAI